MKGLGYTFTTDGNGNTQEGESFTCFHCQKIVIIPPKSRPEDMGGLCYLCYRLVCPNCVGKDCDPFEEKRKRLEASYLARKSYEG